MTVLKNGKFVTPTGILEGDLRIEQGLITKIDQCISPQGAAQVVDLGGKIVMPGAIDAHVHFNEPGRADWEGWETGSRAAFAGGVTTVFEMPLNAHPPTLNAQLFYEKKAVATQKSCIDFGLWGGLTPVNLDAIEELAEAGVIGFKAFMSESGLDDFPRVDRATLHSGMEKIAQTGKILAVHAEDEAYCRQRATEAKKQGLSGATAWLYSRPIEAELRAITEALASAKDTRCKLHIVHISNAEGFELVKAAQSDGVDVTAETCPHYLELPSDCLEELGALAKCAPPLRDRPSQLKLWEALIDGNIDTLGSDHSPCLSSMKLDGSFDEAWGGISGVQHILNPLIHRVLSQGDLGFERLAQISATKVANRFNLADRGSITCGLKADLLIIDPEGRTQVRTEDLYYRNPHSPYVGKEWKGNICGRIFNGELYSGPQMPLPNGRIC